ncbi:MAG: Asp23/Gls24 family envelope stress response protein [Gaiellaceae bacterium]
MEGHSVISPEVLARYAADAAAEVPGVHTIERRGAKVAGAGVEVHVVVDYGANVPTVAGEVQRRVADYLERMTDIRPAAVHVVVEDVQRPS